MYMVCVLCVYMVCVCALCAHGVSALCIKSFPILGTSRYENEFFGTENIFSTHYFICSHVYTTTNTYNVLCVFSNRVSFLFIQ